MMNYNIFIADDEPLIRVDLKELLEQRGYKVVGEAKDGLSALEEIEKCNPDLLILDIKMPKMNGIEIAEKVMHKYPVILLTAYSEQSLIEKAKKADVMSYLIKPLHENHLFPAIELAVKHFIEKSELTSQVKRLKDKLETRKLVEKAKGLIMKDKGISESEAYEHLQRKSMMKNIPMKKLAEATILTLDE